MTYSQALDPTTNCTIEIKLYRNVKNVPDLRKRVINGSLDCCIIKPSLIIDPFQIVIAANKALTSEKMTTKTIYSEILFNLSISKNITQSLQKFGIEDKEKNVLVVAINTNDNLDSEITQRRVFNEIDGEEVDICNLIQFSNRDEIKNAYKLSAIEVKELSMLDSVVSRIATKDLM